MRSLIYAVILSFVLFLPSTMLPQDPRFGLWFFVLVVGSGVHFDNRLFCCLKLQSFTAIIGLEFLTFATAIPYLFATLKCFLSTFSLLPTCFLAAGPPLSSPVRESHFQK